TVSLLLFIQLSLIVLVIFFFFQAEDGIRDWSVTGVQTCALPISSSPILRITSPALSLTSGEVEARSTNRPREVPKYSPNAGLISASSSESQPPGSCTERTRPSSRYQKPHAERESG